jgi:branched-chain amino acid transport system substrate-binding protein
MGYRGESSGRLRRPARRGLAMAALGALLVGVTACGDDDDGGDAGGQEEPTDTTAAVDDVLGPEDPASGEPVRIGMVSDGELGFTDNTDEIRAAEATAEYWNTHRAGVGGRPVEVVPCETRGDPATATDCANQLVEQDVVAVALSQSAVADNVWEPLNAAGVPTLWFQTSSQGATTDTQSSFVMINPLTGLFGLPVSVAESEEADRIAFVVIDVPQARQGLEGLGPTILGNAGLEFDIIPIAPGTADMTAQMQQVAASGAGVVQITGNDAFCIAAFNGLNAVGYDGAVTAVSQCITDATRESVPGEVLEGTYIASTMALGAEEDEAYQRYQAVIETYGDVEDPTNATGMGGYVAMASLLTSLAEISGDVTPQTVIEAIKAMPESDYPGASGMTFQCGGSAIDMLPAVCSNQNLRTTLDAEGNPTGYEVVDASDILP